MRWLTSICVLTGVYLLMLPSLEPWDIGAGVLLSTALVVLFRSYLGLTRSSTGPPMTERFLWLAPFVFRVIRDVTTGAFRVAAMVVHVRPIARAHFIEISVDEHTLSGVALTALVTTLSPGSVLIDVDWSRRVMLLHVLDDAEPEEIRSTFQEFHRRYQRHVVP